MINAFNIACFSRCEKLTEDVLKKGLERIDKAFKNQESEKESRIMTQEEMLNQIKILNATFGGKIVEVT